MYTNSMGPDRGENIWLFLAISMLLHAALLLGYARVSPLSFDTPKRDKEPIEVSVVELPQDPAPTVPEVVKEPNVPQASKPFIPEIVELPKMPESTASEKKPPTVFSDQNRSYERETVPAPPPAPQVARVPAGPAGPADAKDTGKPQTASPKESEQAESSTTLGADIKIAETAKIKDTDEIAAGKAPGAPFKATTRDGEGGPGPNLFPSEGRLAELAREYEHTAPSVERTPPNVTHGKELQLNTSEIKYHKYMLGMKRRIQFRWDYPYFARRNGWQGTLRLDFTINRDGSVTDAHVVKSSGYPVLDEAALNAIKLAAPFPAFSEDIDVDTILIRGWFEYLLYTFPAEPQ